MLFSWQRILASWSHAKTRHFRSIFFHSFQSFVQKPGVENGVWSIGLRLASGNYYEDLGPVESFWRQQPWKSAMFLASFTFDAKHVLQLWYNSVTQLQQRTVTHARDHWLTLYFANAFLSRGVHSRAELVPSPWAYARNGAPRRWLGDYMASLVWLRSTFNDPTHAF